jgi:hypothetical protein
MSRLDDELRKAFRREQPPGDFTARVLERVARQPEPRPGWLPRLAAFFEPPKLRWAAIGATAGLLLAIGAIQYSRLEHKVANQPPKVSQVLPPENHETKNAVNPPANNAESTGASKSPPSPRVSPGASRRHALSAARLDVDREMKARAEAAKEKLMLALSIASATLNDAQRAVHDDRPKR